MTENIFNVEVSGQPCQVQVTDNVTGAVKVLIASTLNYSSSVAGLSDVDLSTLSDGASLIYSETTNRWEAIRSPRSTLIDGGNF